MDNLRNSLKIIFDRCPVDFVLKKWHSSTGIVQDFPSDIFRQIGIGLNNGYTFNDLENLKNKLDEDWFKSVYENNSHKSIFNLLIHFSKYTLTEINEEPVIRYDFLLKWRDLSFRLSEDLITTSYLAFMDIRSGRKRSFFCWRPNLVSDNQRLKKLLSEGMAENHFHLKGSAPIFELSWICLMNNVSKRHNTFDFLKKSDNLNTNFINSFQEYSSDIEILCYKAAFIRQLLFKTIHNLRKTDKSDDFENLLLPYLKEKSNKLNSHIFLTELKSLSHQISSLKYLYGRTFEVNKKDFVADYAIPNQIDLNKIQGSHLLYGERKFMYDCFKNIYANKEDFRKFQDLFYAYLLIKNQLRSELVQLNSYNGFTNFAKYQERKELFIENYPIFEKALYTNAINDSHVSQNIHSFETRISPKMSKLENRRNFKKIKDYVKQGLTISAKKDSKYFHVLHFIKVPEKSDLNDSHLINSIKPRHYHLRKEIKGKAQAIAQLRDDNDEYAGLIKGIDAAASEFEARPEVFGQVFRYLKDHKPKLEKGNLRDRSNLNKLYATFHAGEDYYDIIDGIRTIDEAINFLNLGQGDRISHGLALGVDALEFYESKNYKLLLSAEILLDNIVWILAYYEKFGISKHVSEVYRLKSLYESLFQEIYYENMPIGQKGNVFSSSLFYDSWKLRGDDPMLYFDYKNDVYESDNLTYWDRCKINHFFPNSRVRKTLNTKLLFHLYHFNPEIKSSGKKIKQFHITGSYIKLVQEIQYRYLHYFKTLNIGLETNPTSNFLIGSFTKYSKHPISKFYNLGLEIKENLIKNNPQISVSINTDDQGIFGTSLENEYALMAIALEKERDENGEIRYNQSMIYAWLNNIRKMGIEQSFD